MQYKAPQAINNNMDDAGSKRQCLKKGKKKKKKRDKTKVNELYSVGLFLFYLQEVHYLHSMMECKFILISTLYEKQVN